ncbi:acetyl-CoA carboxylase carboxyltransferase subunit alpha [Clostridium sp. DJ247]|uniref:acetyl-CoA carboxylase carboxyltransferase subunit alpha n=1 Tax=Clostridium sp. DJ247 TaxID=2726188 RepID=UPI001629186F|nr:acetyl-CoA carboxylase carboxyltransferase subunit alpha [Clostridium sp. DJ247]
MEKLEKVQQMISKKFDNKTAWERLTLARMIERPTSLDYIERIFDSFVEFHGDRCFGDDSSVVGGIALLDGVPVTIIAHEKGRNTAEKIKRNFGSPNPEGYRKGLRLMKQAEKFNRPIICFVDTQGAYPGVGAEERGQGEAIAKNLLEMSSLKTPIISIIISEGGSGGALAFAVSDEVWMMENAVYSVLSPEGFASILWKDSSRAKEAAEIMKITAKDLNEFGIIDKVLKEPLGGAHKDVDKMSALIKRELIDGFSMLKKQSIDELLQRRYEKFRNMGKYAE